MTKDVLNSLPDRIGAYFLMDSWYTSADVLRTCEQKGCFLIGAMKTNRILYPNGQKRPLRITSEPYLPTIFTL